MRHQPAVATQPRERALDDPSPADDFEAALRVGAFDDFELDRLVGEGRRKLRPGVASIGEDPGDERKSHPCSADQIRRAVAVLDIGRDHLDAEQQAYRVDQRIALDALGFLARIVPDRIARDPPFSVAFATWVSMIAAVGLASRPSASRHFTSSA